MGIIFYSFIIFTILYCQNRCSVFILYIFLILWLIFVSVSLLASARISDITVVALNFFQLLVVSRNRSSARRALSVMLDVAALPDTSGCILTMEKLKIFHQVSGYATRWIGF